MPIYHYIYVEKEKDKKEAMEVKPKSADMDILDEEEEKFLSAIPVDDSFLGDMDLQPKDAEVVCVVFVLYMKRLGVWGLKGPKPI